MQQYEIDVRSTAKQYLISWPNRLNFPLPRIEYVSDSSIWTTNEQWLGRRMQQENNTNQFLKHIHDQLQRNFLPHLEYSLVKK